MEEISLKTNNNLSYWFLLGVPLRRRIFFPKGVNSARASDETNEISALLTQDDKVPGAEIAGIHSGCDVLIIFFVNN